MTLNEKYCDLVDNDNGFDNQLLADRCEFMAEKFAINFAEYVTGITYKLSEGYFFYYYNGEWKTTKELLEIYKEDYENKTV